MEDNKMINAKNKKVSMKGHPVDLLTDFSHITNSLKNALVESGISEEDANDMLDKAYNLGKMSEDEVKKELMKIVSELFNRITKEEENGNE
jgi:hypothetical protein